MWRSLTALIQFHVEKNTETLIDASKEVDRLCGLVVRVPGYRTVMYYVSCEVRTEFIYVM
jgi:pyruvate-formate lyase